MAQTPFDLIFSPEAADYFSDSVTVYSNDTGQPAFSFVVAGGSFAIDSVSKKAFLLEKKARTCSIMVPKGSDGGEVGMKPLFPSRHTPQLDSYSYNILNLYRGQYQ